jgi:phosphohistidine phosphatase
MKKGERFLVLLRHGIAEERGADKPDAERELTDEGHRRMKEIARGLRKLLPKVEAIYSSPLVRCQQTAAWVARAYDETLAFETTEALAPDGELASFRIQVRRAILVGHEPTLTRFMLGLTRMKSDALELKKGGCYGIRVDAQGAAHLEWMLPPRVTRRL